MEPGWSWILGIGGKGTGEGAESCVPLYLGGARSVADGRLIAGVTKAGHVLVMWGAGAEGNTSCVRAPRLGGL